MLYQWRRPFVLDDRRFRAAFGATPTPMPEQVASTVHWARGAYAPAGSMAGYPVAR